MTAGYALNIERLYGPGIIRVAAKHLLRELAAELGADSHINAARIANNFILRGPSSAKEVAALAKSLMEAVGVTKCRKGAVTALELLFTLPAATTIDARQYFEQATTWAEQHFGVPVLSCVAHMDEGAPHAHALLLPLVDGRMGGSDLHGGKAKLAAMQTSFHEAVGAPHGLPKYVPQKRLSAPVRAAAMALARETLQANAALNDDIIDALLVPHAKDPAPLLLALGIAMPAPKPKAKDFVSIMTAVCKPEPRSPIGKADRRPIGKEILAAPITSLPDTCVGKAQATAPIPSASQPTTSTQPANHPSTNREENSEASQPKAGAQWSGAQRSTTGSEAGQQSAPTASLTRSTVTSPAPTCNAAPEVQAEPGAAARWTSSEVRKTDNEPSTPEAKRQQPSTTSTPRIQTANLAQPKKLAAGPPPAGMQNPLHTPATPTSTGWPAPADVSSSARISLLPATGTSTNQVHQRATMRAQQQVDQRDAPANTSPEQSPAAQGRPDAAQLPHEGEQCDAPGDYQRQRDTDHLAECWDAERGEFVIAPSGQAAKPGRPSVVPYDARAAPGYATTRAPP